MQVLGSSNRITALRPQTGQRVTGYVADKVHRGGWHVGLAKSPRAQENSRERRGGRHREETSGTVLLPRNNQ